MVCVAVLHTFGSNAPGKLIISPAKCPSRFPGDSGDLGTLLRSVRLVSKIIAVYRMGGALGADSRLWVFGSEHTSPRTAQRQDYDVGPILDFVQIIQPVRHSRMMGIERARLWTEKHTVETRCFVQPEVGLWEL